jgi:hypothetical protein
VTIVKQNLYAFVTNTNVSKIYLFVCCKEFCKDAYLGGKTISEVSRTYFSNTYAPGASTVYKRKSVDFGNAKQYITIGFRCTKKIKIKL